MTQGKQYKYILRRMPIIVISFLIIITQPLISSEGESFLKQYLGQKALCNYENAIEIIEKWNRSLDDPVILETNIFRIYELIQYPELIDIAIAAYHRLRNNKIVQNNKNLKTRTKIFLNELYLRKGRISDAKKAFSSLGFLKKYKIIGPFKKENSNFDLPLPPEREFNVNDAYDGKTHPVSWFDTLVDLTGKINIQDLFDDVKNSIFYFRTNIKIPFNGIYVLSLGKTGYTDIWLDGEKKYSNRLNHSFCIDQYRIELCLTSGEHEILIKMGDSQFDGVMLALRLNNDDKDNKIKPDNNNFKNSETENFVESVLKKVSYFNSLDKILNKNSIDDHLAFYAGYLFHVAGLNSLEKSESANYFNKSKSLDAFLSSSYYYLGKIEKDSVLKENYFKKAIKNNKINNESLKEIAAIKIDNNFIYEACQIAQSIKKINPSSPDSIILKAKVLLSHGWHYEALNESSRLKEFGFSSCAHKIESKIYKKLNKFSKASLSYKNLYSMNSLNYSDLDNQIECLKKIGMYKDAEKLLGQCVSFFPNNINLRVKHAELIKNTRGVKAAIPYLIFARSLSPFNKQVLLKIGLAYHKMGKKELALQFLRKASQYDPGNFELKRYIDVISNKKNDIEKYFITDDPETLALQAKKFSNEPVVILLDEVVYKILPDGSSEKWIHKIIKINDSNFVSEFSDQRVIIDPNSDTIENLNCAVINNNEKIERNEVFKSSLSDPESRLYCHLEANIISTASLRKGSILDLSYVIKSRKGDMYRGYFGEKITAGSEYRTIKRNILISLPEKKNIYHYLKGIDKTKLKIIKKDNQKLIWIFIENTLPFKLEIAMPHNFEVLPCIYLSSHKDWYELRRWYARLIQNRIKISEEMKLALAKIIKKNDSDLDKVKKVFNHVTESIRHVGFEFGLSGIQPRTSDLTYQTKMGDCKDISLVLISMLRELGIEAKMALVRTRDVGEANLSFPYIEEFNHAICYVDIGKGFFIDGTSKMPGCLELSGNNRGLKALVIDDSGFDFIDTDKNIFIDNAEFAKTDVQLCEKGAAILKWEIYKSGAFAPETKFRMTDEFNVKSEISEYWNNRFMGSKIHSFEVKNMDVNASVEYNYIIEIPLFYNFKNNEIILKAFLTRSDYYSEFCLEKKRKFPIVLPERSVKRIKIKYNIPPGYDILDMPENEKITNDKYGAVFTFGKSIDSKYVIAESKIRFSDYRVETDEYELFRKFTRFINRKENEKIVLFKKEK